MKNQTQKKTKRDSKKNSPKVNCSFDEMVPLEKLVPNPRNPNKHPESQIAALAKIISHQGWRAPIVVSKRSGFIVAGHGRYEAANVLGETSVPVDHQDFKSEADEWAHLVADNRIAELAEVDPLGLKDVLSDLKDMEFDLDITGFDAANIDSIFSDPQEPSPPEDFKEVDEDIETEHQCPKCQYRWSGKPA